MFSHYDKRTRRTAEIIRTNDESQPANRAYIDLAKPFDDLVKKLEKVNPFKE
ncbi:MAG TPA: hypothetical protein VGM54_07795 [Chthoniobacter sp.]